MRQNSCSAHGLRDRRHARLCGDRRPPRCAVIGAGTLAAAPVASAKPLKILILNSMNYLINFEDPKGCAVGGTD